MLLFHRILVRLLSDQILGRVVCVNEFILNTVLLFSILHLNANIIGNILLHHEEQSVNGHHHKQRETREHEHKQNNNGSAIHFFSLLIVTILDVFRLLFHRIDNDIIIIPDIAISPSVSWSNHFFRAFVGINRDGAHVQNRSQVIEYHRIVCCSVLQRGYNRMVIFFIVVVVF